MKIINIALLVAATEAKNRRPVYRSIAKRPFDSTVLAEKLVNDRHNKNIKGEKPHP